MYLSLSSRLCIKKQKNKNWKIIFTFVSSGGHLKSAGICVSIGMYTSISWQSPSACPSACPILTTCVLRLPLMWPFPLQAKTRGDDEMLRTLTTYTDASPMIVSRKNAVTKHRMRSGIIVLFFSKFNWLQVFVYIEQQQN